MSALRWRYAPIIARHVPKKKMPFHFIFSLTSCHKSVRNVPTLSLHWRFHPILIRKRLSFFSTPSSSSLSRTRKSVSNKAKSRGRNVNAERRKSQDVSSFQEIKTHFSLLRIVFFGSFISNLGHFPTISSDVFKISSEIFKIPREENGKMSDKIAQTTRRFFINKHQF